MKLTICWIISTILFSLATLAQSDLQFDIKTEKGILTVSKMQDGREMILLSTICWDKMTYGTRYSSGNLSFTCSLTLCIEIANKKTGLCRSGIGFSCSMYDCPPASKQYSKLVSNEDRVCSVTVEKISGAVKMIFNDKVDWRSLEKVSEYVKCE